MKYTCKCCGRVYLELPKELRCGCGASLWMEYPHKLQKQDIIQDDFSMWRYEAALPIKKADCVVTLGEGMTPLLRENWNGYEIWIKNESAEPTGSFKDRGIALSINDAMRRGCIHIAEDSSGNAGASTAAYAARAGIQCDIYVPASTSEGKVGQIIAHGANIRKVEGNRFRTAEAAQNGENGALYIGHNWYPAFVEGIKTVAYEIWEQMGFKAPDVFLCAAGNGSMVLGAYLGFRDLLDSGEIEKMPRIYGVQASSCNPISRLFRGESVDFAQRETIAEGIALYRSSKAQETVTAIRQSGGTMIDVDENEITCALRQLVRKGLYAEPTSAAAFAGLTKLQEQGEIKKNERVAITLSGNGLKAIEKIQAILYEKGGEQKNV